MKNLRSTILTLTLVALGSTGLLAMDKAPEDSNGRFSIIEDYLQASLVVAVKNAVEAKLAGCKSSCQLSLSLQELLQTYSVDVLVAPLKDYFRNNPALVRMKNGWGTSALHGTVASNKMDIVRLLLEVAGDGALELMCMQNNQGDLAMHIAVGENNRVMLRFLLRAAGDEVLKLLLIENQDGATALDIARDNGNHVMAQLLSKYEQGPTSMDRALKNVRKARSALKRAELGITGLVAIGQVPEVVTPEDFGTYLPGTLLAELSKDPVNIISRYHQVLIAAENALKVENCQDEKRCYESPETLLQNYEIAAKNALRDELSGYQDLEMFYESLKELLEIYDPVVLVEPLKECFKKNPMLVCMKDEKNRTALHWAADKNNETVAKLLLDAADKSASVLMFMQDRGGNTVLHYAVGNNNQVMVKLLLEVAGQSVQKLVFGQNQFGQTALFFAVRQGSEIMVQSILNAAGKRASDLILLPIERGITALKWAQNKNNQAIIKRLNQHLPGQQ